MKVEFLEFCSVKSGQQSTQHNDTMFNRALFEVGAPVEVLLKARSSQNSSALGDGEEVDLRIAWLVNASISSYGCWKHLNSASKHCCVSCSRQI